ncbi:hypothetical protein [Streptomyces sp. NPDC048419]|uniref:sodium:solute symporter family transporter n=1 Tax=Streptomyces sp. NPDC048419 TaxID=3365547 RepID=UPI0037113ECB
MSACALFATGLASTAGLIMAAATSVAHDLFAHAIYRHRPPEAHEVRIARMATVVIGVVGAGLAVLVSGINLKVLASATLSLSASAVAPVLLYSFMWARFNRTGALVALYGTLSLVVVLLAFSPLVSGNPQALFPDRDFQCFPLTWPGVITIPAGFVLGWLGSVMSRPAPDSASYADAQRIALLGPDVAAAQSTMP